MDTTIPDTYNAAMIAALSRDLRIITGRAEDATAQADADQALALGEAWQHLLHALEILDGLR